MPGVLGNYIAHESVPLLREGSKSAFVSRKTGGRADSDAAVYLVCCLADAFESAHSTGLGGVH